MTLDGRHGRGVSRRAALAGLMLALTAGPVAAAEPAAAAPIEALMQGLMTAMKAGATPFPARFKALAPAVDGAFDLPTILRSSVGPRFAALPADQQQRLQQVFRSFTVASYVASFNTFSGERLAVLPEQRAAGQDVVVQTVIMPMQGEPVHIDYVMRRGAQGWRAIDVLLNGSISQNAVKRSDFRNLVSATSAQPLIDSLQRKVAELSEGTLG